MGDGPRADADGYRIPLFDRSVYAERRRRVVERARQARVTGMVVTVPENICYLTGLDHFGYFAFHALVLPVAGDPVLVARAMERVTVGRDVPDIEFAGYGDDHDPVARCLRVIDDAIGDGPVGLELTGSNVAPAVAEALIDGLGHDIADCSELVDEMRLVQGPEELAVTRRAATVTDAMFDAALETARAGATERDVVSAVLTAMVEAGGEPPAFWPFVRTTNRLNEDHTTWTDYRIRHGDTVFLEMSGSVGRYHAPMGRVVFVGAAPPGAESVATVALDAFAQAGKAAVPGALAGDVYEAWQSVLDAAGLSHYRRHHCGYAVGLGFPPTWSGAGVPRSLRAGSDLVLAEGMVFHQMSWLMGTGVGDYFVSDPVVITTAGAERLSMLGQELRVV